MIYILSTLLQEVKWGKKDYKLYVGASLENMELVSSRFYLRALNMRYVSATRQIDQYLKIKKSVY